MKAIERVYKYIGYKGIKPIPFEKKIKLSNGYLGKQLRRNADLGEGILNKIIENCPEVNPTWLLTGEGDMLLGDKALIKSEKALKENTDNFNFVGYYYPNVDASAGLDFGTYNGEGEKYPIAIPSWGKGLDFINVFGDSMYPKFKGGDIIGIKKVELDYLVFGKPFVVVMKNGDTHLKYVKKGENKQHVLLDSENSFYEPREYHLEIILSFFAVVGVISKLAM